MYPQKPSSARNTLLFWDFRCLTQRGSNTQVEELRSQQSLLPQYFSYPGKSSGFSQPPESTLHSPMNGKYQVQSNPHQGYFVRKQEAFLLHPNRKLTPSGSALQHTALTNSFVSSSFRSLSRTLLTVSNLNVSSVFERPL